jgi:hypothetical protein
VQKIQGLALAQVNNLRFWWFFHPVAVKMIAGKKRLSHILTLKCRK